MAKPFEKLFARQMRQEGASLKEIAHRLNISKGTASRWCLDISLNESQINHLRDKQTKSGAAGRLKGAHQQHQQKQAKITLYEEIGKAQFSSLSQEELLLIGLGLYWGEGFKGSDRVGLTNSDPALIKTVIAWLQICFDVRFDDFIFQVGINEMYAPDLERIHDFWYKITSASPAQFRKASLKRVTAQKVYPNPENHYGTLRVTVRKSSDLQKRILGLIEGIRQSQI